MNRDCHGTWMRKIGVYRCLYDGAFVEAKAKPETCPHCNRPADPVVTSRLPRYRVDTVASIRVPGFKQWQEICRETSVEWEHGNLKTP